MTTFLLLLLAIGLLPFAAGMFFLRPSPGPAWHFPRLGSLLLCALSFNLTFLWQELWLVIPKALTPGLHPVLYHNNHDWTGHAPVTELLQGTGALATFAGGIVFAIALVFARAPITWRLFFFWMAFEGLFQALTQIAIGTLLPGNDVGRALTYLQIGATARWVLLACAVLAVAFAGRFLARAWPADGGPGTTGRTRAFGQKVLLTALLSVILIVPFRLPRNMVEVALVPLFVNLVGAGWLTVGAATAGRRQMPETDDPVAIFWPAIILGTVLLVFQCVLRQGIAF